MFKQKFVEIKEASIKAFANAKLHVEESKESKFVKELTNKIKEFWIFLKKDSLQALFVWNLIIYTTLYFVFGLSLFACAFGWGVSILTFYAIKYYQNSQYYRIDTEKAISEMKKNMESVYKTANAWREDPRVKEAEAKLHEIGIG